MTQLGRERGWPPTTRSQFEPLRGPRGALAVGSPQEVIDKILFQDGIFRHDRHLAQFSVGSMPHGQIVRSIELMEPRLRLSFGRRLHAVNLYRQDGPEVFTSAPRRSYHTIKILSNLG